MFSVYLQNLLVYVGNASIGEDGLHRNDMCHFTKKTPRMVFEFYNLTCKNKIVGKNKVPCFLVLKLVFQVVLFCRLVSMLENIPLSGSMRYTKRVLRVLGFVSYR